MKHPCPEGNSQKGFTLLELLITIVILGVMMVILAQAATLGIQTWDKGTSTQASSQQNSIVTDLIAQQLRSAYPLKIPINKPGDKESTKKLLVFDGGPASVAFVTTKPLGIDNRAGLHLVVYFLEKVKNTPTSNLIVAYRPVYHKKFYETPFQDSEKFHLLSDISKLSFEYFDAKTGAWLPEWIIQDPTQPELPDQEFPPDHPPKTLLPSAVKLHLEHGPSDTTSSLDVLIPIMSREHETQKSISSSENDDDDDDDDDF